MRLRVITVDQKRLENFYTHQITTVIYPSLLAFHPGNNKILIR